MFWLHLTTFQKSGAKQLNVDFGSTFFKGGFLKGGFSKGCFG
jgi:hypothetical protein